MRVLIVDDEIDIARMLGRFLERDGFTVSLAHSLDEALSAQGPFDLVVADVRLPNGDGRHLKECFVGTPFLTMSGYSGELPDLPKPFTPDVFRAAVQQAVKP